MPIPCASPVAVCTIMQEQLSETNLSCLQQHTLWMLLLQSNHSSNDTMTVDMLLYKCLYQVRIRNQLGGLIATVVCNDCGRVCGV